MEAILLSYPCSIRVSSVAEKSASLFPCEDPWLSARTSSWGRCCSAATRESVPDDRNPVGISGVRPLLRFSGGSGRTDGGKTSVTGFDCPYQLGPRTAWTCRGGEMARTPPLSRGSTRRDVGSLGTKGAMPVPIKTKNTHCDPTTQSLSFVLVLTFSGTSSDCFSCLTGPYPAVQMSECSNWPEEGPKRGLSSHLGNLE